MFAATSEKQSDGGGGQQLPPARPRQLPNG